MDRNKQVTCKICYREMRSDNLKRHMNVHEIKFIDEEDASFNHLDIYCQNKNVLNLNNIQNQVVLFHSGRESSPPLPSRPQWTSMFPRWRS